jgi:hypothetical protein
VGPANTPPASERWPSGARASAPPSPPTRCARALKPLAHGQAVLYVLCGESLEIHEWSIHYTE